MAQRRSRLRGVAMLRAAQHCLHSRLYATTRSMQGLTAQAREAVAEAGALPVGASIEETMAAVATMAAMAGRAARAAGSGSAAAAEAGAATLQVGQAEVSSLHPMGSRRPGSTCRRQHCNANTCTLLQTHCAWKQAMKRSAHQHCLRTS